MFKTAVLTNTLRIPRRHYLTLENNFFSNIMIRSIVLILSSSNVKKPLNCLSLKELVYVQ